MRIAVIKLLCFGSICLSYAQNSFFGGLQWNTNFYVRDTTIGGSGNPLYDNLKAGSDIWLNLDYMNDRFGIDAGIRVDGFLHSNLHHPGTPYTAAGVGRFYVRKRGEKYRITGGYFYDQYGSGIIFRAYEDRTLGIDNAILGVHAEVDPIEKLKIKAFTGVQKNRLEIFKPIIIGLNAESNFSISEKVKLLPGVSVVNRTIDQTSMDFIVEEIETYLPDERFVPKYNTYAFSAYNTLVIGDLSWFAEFVAKTPEAIRLQNGKLEKRSGNVFYTTLNYSRTGFGAALQFKRTQNFQFRTSPNEMLLDGMLNFIPPVTKQNSLRLPARYVAAVQELEELSYSADATFSPIIKKLSFNFNYAEVRDFSNELKFREAIGNAELKFKRTWRAIIGVQYMQYNQEFYEGEVYGNYDLVKAITPFAQLNWKVNRRHALTFDVQQQFTREDFGSWLFAQIEYSISPWFSIALSDMFNYDPNAFHFQPYTDLPLKKNHYYSAVASFTWNSHIITGGYVRQVSGIVCTGGVCRYEPAFSGVKLTLNSTF